MAQPAKKMKLDNSFMQKSNDLYLHEISADVNFFIISNDKKEYIVAHKSILAGKSSVFRDMFFESFTYGDGSAVPLKGVSKGAFEEFLQFFYKAKVELTAENISEVMGLIKEYNVPECFATCDAFLEGQEDILFSIRIAIAHERCALVKDCINKMSVDECSVFVTNGFPACEKNVLKAILEDGGLKCSAKDIFEGCLNWSKQKCEDAGLDESNMENRKQQLGDDCFQLIPFAKMSCVEIKDFAKTYDTLFDRKDFVGLIDIVATRNTNENGPSTSKRGRPILRKSYD